MKYPCLAGLILAASCTLSPRALAYETVQQPYIQLSSQPQLNAAQFSPNSARVVTANNTGAQVWDRATGHVVLSISHTSRVNSAVYSPNGASILTGDQAGAAHLFNATTGAHIADFQCTASVVSALFHPDGQRVVCGTSAGIINVFSSPGGQLLRTMVAYPEQHSDNPDFNISYTYLNFALSRDGSRVLASVDIESFFIDDDDQDHNCNVSVVPIGGGTPQIINPETADLGSNVTRHFLFSMSPAAGSQVLLAGQPGFIELYDFITLRRVRIFRHTGRGPDFSAAISPSNALIATNDDGLTLNPGPAFVTRNTEGYELVRGFGGAEVEQKSFVWSPDNQWILTSNGSLAEIWPAQAPALVDAWPAAGVNPQLAFLNIGGATNLANTLLEPGEELNLQWNAVHAAGTVDVKLFRGEVYQRNLATLPLSASNFTFNPAGVSPGSSYQFRIYNKAVSGQFSDSANFTLADLGLPSLTMQPISATNIHHGDQLTLNWSSHAVTGSVYLMLYHGSSFVNYISTQLPVENGQFTWTVSAPMAATFQIRIQSNDDPAIQDMSVPIPIAVP